LILSVDRLNLSFEDKSGRRKILDDVSFSIEEGEIVGIVGLSGAGKTSLLRTLNLLQPVDSGSIMFDGQNIVGLNESKVRSIRKKIGVVFQSYNLFRYRTVYQNIAFPLKIQGVSRSEIKERVMSIVSELGLEHRLGAYPSQLSGGEQQRAAIARALVMNPKLILLDEPTSALDPRTTGRLLDLVVNLNERRRVTFAVFDIMINILYGKIEELKNGPFGTMIIAIDGHKQDQFIEKLRDSVFFLEEVR